ncbi:MAG: hypothetical protein M3Z05_07945 [Gemmatimonadota bacterium]|nr:hypothetical protein [Gemmatimonadota bacterium]
MTEARQSPDLSSLAADYDIVGEMGGARDARTYMATRKAAAGKRRDDQTAVLISVVTSPDGDEGNALSHLAADTKLLAANTHRRLVPVVEGRWLGADAFAVVTQRTSDPSLTQILATREKFSTTRVAAIVREINGLLEWARAHNVTHRGLSADRIFLEPKTDRVRVTFGLLPIRRLQPIAAATEDARAIVHLVLTMLTGFEDPGDYDGQTLAELRPDLPVRLRDETTAMLEADRVHTPDDVKSYLALVGMADPLLAGETEADRIRAEVLEEQRVEREKLANERAEFERTAAEERAAFEKYMADERATYERQKTEEGAAYEKVKEDEHAAFERAKANERERAAKEKEELQRAVTAERAALVAFRAELERTAAAQRAEVERIAAEDRRQIEALRAQLKAAGELEIEKKREAALEDVSDVSSTLDDEEFNAPVFVPLVNVPYDEPSFDDDTALMRDDDIVDEPVRDAVAAASSASVASLTDLSAGFHSAVTHTAPSRRKWQLPAAIAALVILIGGSVIALASRNAAPVPVQAPVAKSVVAPSPAPVVAAPSSVIPIPVTPPQDSAAVAASRRADSLRSKTNERLRTTSSGGSSQTPAATASPTVFNRTAQGDSVATRRDSLARRDSAPRFRRATQPQPRRDTVPQFRDATQPQPRRDTLVRRDTSRVPRIAPM